MACRACLGGMMHCNQIVCLVEWVGGGLSKEALYVAIRQVRMQVAATVPLRHARSDNRFEVQNTFRGSEITHDHT